MTATWKQKRLTLTENHNVVLRLDNGDAGPLRTIHIMLTFTDMILHSKIAKVKCTSVRDAYTVLFVFLRYFVQMGCKKPDFDCTNTL